MRFQRATSTPFRHARAQDSGSPSRLSREGSMRKLLTLLFTFSGLTVATLSYGASGTVDITWGNTCTPVVTDITPAVGPVSMIASVIGNDETHAAYQVRYLIASAALTVPDAWRFDAAGCQGSGLLT